MYQDLTSEFFWIVQFNAGATFLLSTGTAKIQPLNGLLLHPKSKSWAGIKSPSQVYRAPPPLSSGRPGPWQTAHYPGCSIMQAQAQSNQELKPPAADPTIRQAPLSVKYSTQKTLTGISCLNLPLLQCEPKITFLYALDNYEVMLFNELHILVHKPVTLSWFSSLHSKW